MRLFFTQSKILSLPSSVAWSVPLKPLWSFGVDQEQRLTEGKGQGPQWSALVSLPRELSRGEQMLG